MSADLVGGVHAERLKATFCVDTGLYGEASAARTARVRYLYGRDLLEGTTLLILFEGFGLILLALWVFCILDVITTDEHAVRNLPKMMWLIIVLILPDIGSVLWLIAGRPKIWERPQNLPYKGNSGRVGSGFPESDRPGRFAAANPDDDEAYLQSLRDRVEEQRRKAREQNDKDGPSS